MPHVTFAREVENVVTPRQLQASQRKLAKKLRVACGGCSFAGFDASYPSGLQ